MRVMLHMVSTSRGPHSYIVRFVPGYNGHAIPYRGWFSGGEHQSEQIALITLRSTAMM